MAFTLMTLACSIFAIAYARECGKVVELTTKITRLENALRGDDYGTVIEVDFRRH